MNRRDFLCGTACILASVKLWEILKTKKSQDNENIQFGFNIALASHCNLNCKYCDTYSPLSKQEFATYDQVIKDLKKMKKLLNDTNHFDGGFIGGEALLNPELEKIIEKIIKLFPNGQKTILTNGLLLNNKGDYFWDLMKRANIEFGITHYPIKIDRKKYEELAKKHDVKITYHYVQSNKLYDLNTRQVIHNNYNQDGFQWSQNIIDLTGSQEIKTDCQHKGIITYARGNIYACYVHAHINAFKEYFNKDIKITEEDYLKVQDIKTKEEYFNFLETPKPLCKYCKQCHNTCFGGEPLEWGFSEKKITEWT